MVKVLIGNKNIQKGIKNFQFLQESNEFEVVTSSSATEIINKCQVIEPAIIVLNSNLPDMVYTEVIDRISNLPNEFNKCNLILTIDKPEDKLLLSNTSIIYRVFDNNSDEKIARETINTLKAKFEIPALTIKELRNILLSLGINTYSIGSQYLISVIFKCYYYPENFVTLDNVYKLVADEYHISNEQIKNSIRHTIDTFNRSYNLSNKSLYLKIFENEKDISPKRFIQMLVNYLNKIKSKD